MWYVSKTNANALAVIFRMQHNPMMVMTMLEVLAPTNSFIKLLKSDVTTTVTRDDVGIGPSSMVST